MGFERPSKSSNKGSKGSKKPAKRESRWAGVEPRDASEHPDALEVGFYRCRCISNEERYSEKSSADYWHAGVEVVFADDKNNCGTEVGTECNMIFATSGKGGRFGMQDIKAYVVALAGYGDFEAYAKYDSDGEMIDALIGHDNSFSEAAESMIGRLIDIEVKRGRDDDKGSFFRNYVFYAVEDSDQDGGE